MLTIQLLCGHRPHQCRCRHNVETEVEREDLTANLISMSVISKNIIPHCSNTLEKERILKINLKQISSKYKVTRMSNHYRSIVEEKGLNFCLDPNNHSSKPTQKVESPQKFIQQEEPAVQPQKQKPVVVIHPHRPAPKSKQAQIHKFHKDLKQQSRYLSDTAFRKYFNRQCFENYGRNNTSGKADGIIYGNYMKTHNINPHTGQNIPLNQETFYHALVTGSPDKYANYAQESKLAVKEDRQPERDKSLSKSRLNVEQMLKDNQKHSEVVKKYEHLHLKPKEETVVRSPKGTSSKYYKGPSELELHTKKHFKQQSIAAAQNKVSRQSRPEYLRPNTQSLLVQEPTPIKNYQNPPSNISINQGLRNNQQTSPKQSQFQPAQQVSTPKQLTCNHQKHSIECQSCLNKMKGMILQLTEKDPDLAQRIITSAQKQVRYKNFALNNYENAGMNPHNFRSDGRLNVYQNDN